MDPRLIDFYEAELEYLRAQSLEFAENHETVATRLGLSSTDRDPYVERLLEGVAFLSSRVHLKINDQFPEFTQHLLQAVQPISRRLLRSASPRSIQRRAIPDW